MHLCLIFEWAPLNDSSCKRSIHSSGLFPAFFRGMKNCPLNCLMCHFSDRGRTPGAQLPVKAIPFSLGGHRCLGLRAHRGQQMLPSRGMLSSLAAVTTVGGGGRDSALFLRQPQEESGGGGRSYKC